MSSSEAALDAAKVLTLALEVRGEELNEANNFLGAKMMQRSSHYFICGDKCESGDELDAQIKAGVKVGNKTEVKEGKKTEVIIDAVTLAADVGEPVYKLIKMWSKNVVRRRKRSEVEIKTCIMIPLLNVNPQKMQDPRVKVNKQGPITSPT